MKPGTSTGIHPPLQLCLHQFNQKIGLCHQPGNFSHRKGHCGDRPAQQQRSAFSKMADGCVNIGNLIADMIGSSAFLQRTVNGGVWPQGSDKLDRCISFAAAHKADGYILDRVVEWTRNEFVVEKALVAWNRSL